MVMACPVCGRDVHETKVNMKFGARVLPLYQCTQCPKSKDFDNVTFALMPDGAKLDPADVLDYLAKLRVNSRESGRRE